MDYSIKLEPNKSYFILGEIGATHVIYGTLTIVSPEKGRSDLAKLNRMTELENLEGSGPDTNTHWLN